LNLFLEGPYENGQMSTILNQSNLIPHQQPFNDPPWFYPGEEQVENIPNSMVVDWVLLELRETPGGPWTATSESIIYRGAAFLLNNGNIVGLDGSSNLRLNITFEDNLYAVIWHRNHIGIMTSMPLQLSGNSYYYNFTTGPDKVYNWWFCYKELATGTWGMIAGDANADGFIDEYDKNDTLWNQIVGNRGYNNFDLNQDGQTNNIDKNDYWQPNMGKGTQVPE